MVVSFAAIRTGSKVMMGGLFSLSLSLSLFSSVLVSLSLSFSSHSFSVSPTLVLFTSLSLSRQLSASVFTSRYSPSLLPSLSGTCILPLSFPLLCLPSSLCLSLATSVSASFVHLQSSGALITLSHPPPIKAAPGLATPIPILALHPMKVDWCF